MKRLAALLALLIVPSLALAQNALLQGGPWTPGHVPQYVGQGSVQAIVQDGGAASGGGVGANISELGITARGTGTPPYSGQGTGPYGTNACDYDAPTTNATGYHYLCFSANASNGQGVLAFGAGGGAATTNLDFILNGTTYAFPFITSGIVGPSTTVVGDAATWNNTVGTLLKDAGGPPLIGGASTAIGTPQTTIVETATGSSQNFTLQNSGAPATSGTNAQFIAQIGTSQTNEVTLSAAGASNPSGNLTSGSGLTGGLNISASAGSLTLTYPQFTFGTGSTQTIAATSANTANSNQLVVANSGTSSNSGTFASLEAELSCANCNIQTYAQGGASPTAYVTSGSGMTGGLTISAGAGTLSITQPTISVPTFTFGTGSTSTIAASSANTGFVDLFQVYNTGTSSNAGSVAEYQAQLNCSSCNADFYMTGGATPSATLTTGAGTTGGFTISAGAGTLNITSPTIATPSFMFGTGATSTITASSANTGFGNVAEILNSGTSSNASTEAIVSANLSCANCGLQLITQGGTNPSATLGSGSGLTGGLTISASAGTLQITQPLLGTPQIAGLELNAGYAIANLPSCGTATKGGGAFVTNGTPATPTYLAAVGTNTGTTQAKVFCNGTAWVYD